MASTLARRFARLARPRRPESLPVALERKRIYVLPTRFGLFFATLVFTMLLGALNYNNNPALLLALLLGATAMASLIFAHLQLAGLRIDALSADPVPVGTPLLLHVALASRDARVRHGLRLDAGDEHAFAVLLAGENQVVELSLPTHQRGWYDLDRVRLSTTQPLGLARAWAWVWPDTPLLVYPATEVQGPPLPQAESGGTRARLDPAGEDVHQLRNYRAGDARRAIAWKPSARRSQLLVRDYEQPLGRDVDLDWDALTMLSPERRIQRLAHWIETAEREGLRYLLRLPGQPALGPGNGLAHRHLCLRALALLPHETA
ncbi:uncharacterized protein (DUF58 family) [Pseudoxanthomonas japonensis]|uniref:DUF58 domain-containing protein n=1 Tax=Pseudoxanthomonas TaxID=83618 RepID=UPI00078052B7|nr:MULTISPECIES: DUF58 domain-containing protein [Pseudoxanthomonas]MBA3930996.1 DUF58 domain-containing protein [Xanthomonas sp.]MBL8255446.1 DUF58 domain-containing protein [Pseudoxanthomonas mexicana]MDR7067320.1 uncharacterized protein (DUF58 family) [Pseudoxanthomonas japonensis]